MNYIITSKGYIDLRQRGLKPKRANYTKERLDRINVTGKSPIEAYTNAIKKCLSIKQKNNSPKFEGRVFGICEAVLGGQEGHYNLEGRLISILST